MLTDDNAVWMLGLLEALAYKLGILVRYEALTVAAVDSELRVESGACRLRGKEVIIVDRRLSPRKKCEVLSTALRKRDLSGIFVPPAVRVLLDP